MNTILFTLLQFTWSLPQNLAGLILWCGLRLRYPEARRYRYRGAWVTQWPLTSSMSLGSFIFFGHGESRLESVMLVHEYGHCIQSLILGPLYLFVIGFPSLCWANIPACVTYWRRPNRSYFRFYTERWANALGAKVTGESAPEWGDL